MSSAGSGFAPISEEELIDIYDDCDDDDNVDDDGFQLRPSSSSSSQGQQRGWGGGPKKIKKKCDTHTLHHNIYIIIMTHEHG